MHPYRRLLVWKKAHALAVHARAVTYHCRAPDLALQIRRAAASVPTNIVEGAGSQSNGQFVRYLGIALASSQETEYLLLLARDTSAIGADHHKVLSAECEEVQRMLGGLIAAIRRGMRAGAAAGHVPISQHDASARSDKGTP
jgi:four helix bundle protein